jgi:hypothetical protein
MIARPRSLPTHAIETGSTADLFFQISSLSACQYTRRRVLLRCVLPSCWHATCNCHCIHTALLCDLDFWTRATRTTLQRFAGGLNHPMKTALLVAVAIVIFSSLPFVSRQTNAAAQENSSAHAVRAQENYSTVTPIRAPKESTQAPASRGLRSANGDFMRKRDSQSAKPPVTVPVNTNEKAKTIALPQAK